MSKPITADFITGASVITSISYGLYNKLAAFLSIIMKIFGVHIQKSC